MKIRDFAEIYGIYALILQQAWIFLNRVTEIYVQDIYQNTIINAIHLGPHAFDELAGEVVQTVSFVQRKVQNLDYEGKYLSLVKYESEEGKRQGFF